MLSTPYNESHSMHSSSSPCVLLLPYLYSWIYILVILAHYILIHIPRTNIKKLRSSRWTGLHRHESPRSKGGCVAKLSGCNVSLLLSTDSRLLWHDGIHVSSIFCYHPSSCNVKLLRNFTFWDSFIMTKEHSQLPWLSHGQRKVWRHRYFWRELPKLDKLFQWKCKVLSTL